MYWVLYGTKLKPLRDPEHATPFVRRTHDQGGLNLKNCSNYSNIQPTDVQVELLRTRTELELFAKRMCKPKVSKCDGWDMTFIALRFLSLFISSSIILTKVTQPCQSRKTRQSHPLIPRYSTCETPSITMIRASDKANRTKNPIRNIVDNLKPPVDHPKTFINLLLGDPTLYGNLKCPDVLKAALQECLTSNKCDGYFPSIGSVAARNAVAERVTNIANTAILKMQNTPGPSQLSFVGHQVSTDKNSQKMMYSSWSSNLTDSFSYENKKCDDVSDTCEYPENTIGENDSLDGNHIGCDKSCTEAKTDERQLIETAFLHFSDPLQQNSGYKKEAKQYQPTRNCKNKISVHSTNSLPTSVRVTADDVIITSGCSGAVEMAISALLNEGDNILVPRPGFPLYQVVTESIGGCVKQYPLKPESDWECDTAAMEALIDSNTRAILVTNPSNPCGSNYSAEHLLSVIAVARKHSLPIIADEIYGGCVFDEDSSFTPLCSLCDDVPILSLGGLAKEFVVPGWRVGWIIVHDAYGLIGKNTHRQVFPTAAANLRKNKMRMASKKSNALRSKSSDINLYISNSTISSYGHNENNGNRDKGTSEFNGARRTNAGNYTLMNGKNSDCNYDNVDMDTVNENIRRANSNRKEYKVGNLTDCTHLYNSDNCHNRGENKINLKEYHMNGTVDIDELLINYINQNDGYHSSLDSKKGFTPLSGSSSIYLQSQDEDEDEEGDKINLAGLVSASSNCNAEDGMQVGRLSEVRKGLRNLTQLTLGASSLLQSALPSVLNPRAGSAEEASLLQFHEHYMQTLRKNTNICVNMLKSVPELSMNIPKGAMYVMLEIRFDLMFDILDDKDFAEKLLVEENLSVLPGACFNMGGYVRLVLCPPEAIFVDALERLERFCSRHNFINQ